MALRNLVSKNSVGLVTLLLATTLSILLSSGSLAQDTDRSDSIEEILVTAEISLRAMKNQMVEAQDVAFDLFNEVYAGTDYEIICKLERPFKDGFDPINVHRSVRICDSRYVREQEEQATEDYLLGFGTGSTMSSFDDIEHHIEEVDQKIAELFRADPNFRQKVNDWEALKDSYEAALDSDQETGFWSSLFRPIN